jgi:colicin import membrane protein
MSELDALRARLAQLWNPPIGAGNPEELIVRIQIRLKPDGTLAAPPGVISSGQSARSIAAADSAVRAVRRGQPFDMLRPEHYEQWKDIEITFDPRDMIRG